MQSREDAHYLITFCHIMKQLIKALLVHIHVIQVAKLR